MRTLHLFAGGGGSHHTGNLLGWDSVGSVEIDDYCQAILRENHGDHILAEDITTWDATPLRGHVDLVVGGWPCQTYSVAGEQVGLAASDLFYHFMRVIDETQAPFFFGENVSGILTAGLDKRDFAVILDRISASGFDAEWSCLGADQVGAPHQRDRIWILGWRRDVAKPAGFRKRKQTDETNAITTGRGAWLEPGRSSELAHGDPDQSQRSRELGQLVGASGTDEGRVWERERNGDAAGRGGAVGRGELGDHSSGGRGEGEGREEHQAGNADAASPLAVTAGERRQERDGLGSRATRRSSATSLGDCCHRAGAKCSWDGPSTVLACNQRRLADGKKPGRPVSSVFVGAAANVRRLQRTRPKHKGAGQRLGSSLCSSSV